MDDRASGSKRKRKRKQGAATYISGATDESDADDEDAGLAQGFNGGMDVDHEMGEDKEVGMSRSKPVVIVDSGFSTVAAEAQPKVTTIDSGVGSTLKRDANGNVLAPRVAKKKAKGAKSVFASWKDKKAVNQAQAEESDTSFDSSDSAYDTNDEDEKEKEESDGKTSGSDSDSEQESTPEDGKPTADQKPEPEVPRKKLGFKQWALQQLSQAKGYVPPPSQPEEEEPSQTTPKANLADPKPPPPKKRKTSHDEGGGEMRGPLGETLVMPNTAFAKHLQESSKNTDGSLKFKRKVVTVQRPPDVEEARMDLPIVAQEQEIMEAILLNSVVIICGETGSGKTTQVPQFLYEAGFGSPGSDNPGMIGITQPRRVAALSMASRVAHELSLPPSKVSYQIRYDASVSPDTAIKFMTDGVLLRELASDFLLRRYSVVVVDEAHERSLNTDVLVGVLSRVVKLREEMWLQGKDDIKPLRLIIMSATLRITDFTSNKTLFPTAPPIISVPTRQHPVTIHFSRRTSPDYVGEAIKKVSKIHARLPPGGILVFLTGQNEIMGVVRRLEGRYGVKALEERKRRRVGMGAKRPFGDQEDGKDNVVKPLGVAPAQADVEAEDVDLGVTPQEDLAEDVDGDQVDVDLDAEALDSDEEEAEDRVLGIDKEESDTPMHIVPLYALLPSEKQMKVFKPPPDGHRLVVVSTNVAETSITIPGIRYVVDCGRAKERRYDVTNGIQAFQISWISKASAAQRAGRAGRTGPGHCYRLYSSALFEHHFAQFAEPEILRMPIEGVVLQMKAMHIDAVVNFPFPTPPDRVGLRKAERVLTWLGALKDGSGSGGADGEITDIGRAMSLFPLSPRYSRMLVSGRQHGCLPYVIAMVSALSVGDPFLREEALDADPSDEEEDEDEALAHLTSEAVKAKEARKIRRKAFFQSQAIHSSLGHYSSDVFRILSVVGAYEYAGGGHKFCEEHFVRPKAMEEIHKLRAQISSIVQTNFPEADAKFIPNLKPPSALQLKVLRQLLAAGFIDQVAFRKDRVSQESTSAGKQFTTSRGVPYQAMGIAEDVYIHPSSVLANVAPPECVVFLEVVRTSRVYIKGVTVVNPAWLPTLGKALCTYSKPVMNKDGESMVIPRFGPHGWELPPIKASAVSAPP
ncbi:P-loop containing nucleoside triphosphate hydrolase protein [Panus rudis PR-1116 ss-1]|nr:P-loop containing nucleoside triphosphate hydrolase protein [Panus rudis PR-1116 ss-1]